MKRITTAAALRTLAKKIMEITENAEACDEAYCVNLDAELSKIEEGENK